MSFFDPLNTPPPETRRFASYIAHAPSSPLEQLIIQLSKGSYRWRIRRMVKDYRWLERLATERGIQI